MEIYVIRHTQVDVKSGTCYGQSEVALKSSFKEETQRIKSELNVDFDIVFVSPFSRCTLLAEELGYSKYNKDKRLCELNFGQWELKEWANINVSEIDKWSKDIVNLRLPDGENLNDLYNRVSDFMNELIKRDYEKVLIITHAGVIRCLWAYLLEFPLKNLFCIPVDFGEVFSFSISKNKEMINIIRKS